MDYKLHLTIKPEDLAVLTACGMNIILAKPLANDNPNVAWVAFEPFQEGTVSWIESYGLYASTTQYQSGAVIEKTSRQDPSAQDGILYLFGKDQIPNFTTGSGSCDQGSFRIKDLMAYDKYPSLIFGLTQNVQCGDKKVPAACINASRVPSQADVTFTPYTTVRVWLQAHCVTGSIITEITTKSVDVRFGGDVTENSLVYDPHIGAFVATPKGREDRITLRKPALIY
jgi:hypothetical protein